MVNINYLYNILSPITFLIGNVMKFLYYIISYADIENVGICIIILTFVINIMMLPFTIKQQKFSRISRIMTPKIQKLQKKYKGKMEQESIMKQQQEIQEIYKEYGINPMGNFGQIFIQMIIFMCLYKVISNIPYYIPNVTDSAFIFLGLNIMKIPGLHLTPAIVIPILSGITQWISVKISMINTSQIEDEAMNATMNSINTVMPLMSIFMCISLPMYMGALLDCRKCC